MFVRPLFGRAQMEASLSTGLGPYGYLPKQFRKVPYGTILIS